MEHIKIKRIFDNGVQTIGKLKAENKEGKVFKCLTMELPYLNNERRISCIPKGEYWIKEHESPKFGFCYKVYDKDQVSEVAGRSEILIHLGNYHRDTLGCILPGASAMFIDSDDYLDVSQSGNTTRALINHMEGSEFKLIIE